MNWQALLSIIAATFGVVAGLWLCLGAALITPERIAKADDNSFKAAPDIAGALISQSAEYLAGGLLLVVSFFLQIVAAQASQTTVQVLCPMFLSLWFLVPTTVLSSLLLSYPTYVLRKRYLNRRLSRS